MEDQALTHVEPCTPATGVDLVKRLLGQQRAQPCGQTIIAGMGELHLEIIVDRMKREFGVEANVGKPQVAYRETITQAAPGKEVYKKQTGGRGQYGHVEIEVELAQVVEVIEVDGVEPRVERLDDARAHFARAAIRALDDAQVRELRCVRFQDLRRVVRRAVVDDDPERRRDTLRSDAVERAAHVLRLVTARTDEHVFATVRHGQ